MFQDNVLHQQILEATRGNNIVDLVFSNRVNTITNLDIDETLENSDHYDQV